jgi:multidrug efflux pump subunit AcrA (membrane-fusion protein)
MRILIGIVVLAVLAFFGYRMFQTEEAQQAVQQAAQQVQATAQQATEQAKEAAAQAQQAAGEAAKAASEAAQQAAGLVVGGVDVGAELERMMEQASTALGGITDQASAEAALPSLEQLKGKVDGLTTQVDQLPAEGRKMLAGLVGTALPSLKELAGKVGTVQGAEVIKPTLDALVAKLETWANAPA